MDLKYNYFINLIWALTVFVSFIGYGRLLAEKCRWSTPATHAWSWHAVWGMAAVVAVGGFLMAFALAKAAVLIVIVLGGALMWLWQTNQDIFSKRIKADPRGWLKDLPFWVLMAVYLLAAISWPYQIDPNDDLLLYLTMPVRILQEGTLLEPFSYRRAGTFGGHSLLQALMMSLGSERSGHVVDMGWCRLVLFGMTASLLPDLRRLKYPVYLVLLSLLFVLPIPRINTMSSLSGAVFVLAVFVHLIKARELQSDARVIWLPLALVLLAGATMRPNFAAQAGGAVFIAGLFYWYQLTKEDSHRVLRTLFSSFAALAFLLIPWMSVLYRSNGTVALPPFYGWTEPAFLDMSSRLGVWTDLRNAVSSLFRPEVLGFVAGIWVFARRNSAGPVAWAVALSTTAFCFYLSYKCSIVIPSETFRYMFPMLIAAFILIVGTWLNDIAKESCPLLKTPMALGVLLVGGIIGWTQVPQGARELQATWATIPVEVKQNTPMVQGGADFFRQLQATVPSGTKVLAIVDFPFLLDYRRNTIYNIDAVGGSSLPPGLPYFSGAEAVRKYLLQNDIRYVMSVRFDKAVLMYTRRLWQHHNRPEWYFTEVWGKHSLDLMDSIDEFEHIGQVIAGNENYRVIDLKKD